MAWTSRRHIFVTLCFIFFIAEALGSQCSKHSFRSTAVKLLEEYPFVGLFNDLKNQTRFEASGVVRANDSYYVVFDNSYLIGKLECPLRLGAEGNVLLGDDLPNSQFEGIAYVPETDTFLLLQETRDLGHAKFWKPNILDVQLNGDTGGYDTLHSRLVDYRMTHKNKGLESIVYVDGDLGKFVLGLCEGNYCKGGSQGKRRGQGRILALEIPKDSSQEWNVSRTINIPQEVYFKDYSAMALDPETNRIAILSQEDSAFWIGRFNVDTLQFDKGAGTIYHFPRNDDCEMEYCNVEGIAFVDDHRVAVVSDEAKSKQSFVCDKHDQAIQVFALPGETHAERAGLFEAPIMETMMA